MAELSTAHETVSFAAADLPVSTLTLAVLFGVIFFVWARLKLDALRSTPEEADPALAGARLPGLKLTRQSFLLLTKEMTVLGLIVLYAWFCENRPLFAHLQKEHVPDFFWFITFMVLMFSLGSVHFDPKAKDLVNRDQTEEWKGGLQTMFLLYHYMHENEVYNFIRFAISCYVWMTGFGNLSFFYLKRDFGFVRFAQMLWRLNFTVVFLSMGINNSYMLYYICPLHTFYFLMVYFTMRAVPSVNHSKFGLRFKLMCLGGLIFVVWEFQQAFDLAFYLLPTTLHPGAAVGAYGISYEWHFRSGLDHYSTFFGMIFACNFPQAQLWMAKVEALPQAQHVLVKGAVGAVLLVALHWWATEIFPLPKLEFNSWNPYTFMIPLLSYLFFRNATPWLRHVHMGILATIGKYTLETYLLQHHVWLTSNAKTVLAFVPAFPKINLVLVTFTYFALARRVFRVTMVTRALVIPDDAAAAAVHIGAAAGLLGVSGAVAWALQMAGAVWAVVLPVVGALGFLASSAVARAVTPGAEAPMLGAGVSWGRARGLLLLGLGAALVGVVLLPLAANVGAPVNDGPLRSPLEAFTRGRCLQRLGVGEWHVNRHACASHNDPLCVSETWLWSDHNAEKACGFHPFDESKTQRLLAGRTVTVIGDENAYKVVTALLAVADGAQGFAEMPRTEDGFEMSFSVKGGGKVRFLYAASAQDVKTRAASARSSSSSSSSAGKGKTVYVLGAWTKDLQDGSDAKAVAAAWKQLVAGFSDADPVVVLTAGSVFEEKLPPGSSFAGIRDGLAKRYADETMARLSLSRSTGAGAGAGAGDAADAVDEGAARLVVDFRAITEEREGDCSDGVHFGAHTYTVPAQLVLNAYELVFPVPEDPAAAGSSKGHGGGVAISPATGLAVLALAACMLFSMDIYGGIGMVALKLVPPHMSVSWDESVRDIHRAMGLVDKYEPVDSVGADDAEAGPLAPSAHGPGGDGPGGDGLGGDQRAVEVELRSHDSVKLAQA